MEKYFAVLEQNNGSVFVLLFEFFCKAIDKNCGISEVILYGILITMRAQQMQKLEKTALIGKRVLEY